MYIDAKLQYSYDHFKNFLDLVECINLYYALCGGLDYEHKRNMLFLNSFNTCTCSTKLSNLLNNFSC